VGKKHKKKGITFPDPASTENPFLRQISSGAFGLTVRPKLTENEARYIARMINSIDARVFLPPDATDEDVRLLEIMRDEFHKNGGSVPGREAQIIWIIMHVTKYGVPGGKYLDMCCEERMNQQLERYGAPKIERPS
jgi:hypothetical protein